MFKDKVYFLHAVSENQTKYLIFQVYRKIYLTGFLKESRHVGSSEDLQFG